MTDQMLPAQETAPAAWYRDPALWPIERTQIFGKSWQFLTHESALPEAGSWAAATIAGYPILILRDGLGELKGFHNVCRHRAGPLTKGESGRCEGGAITCQYHGWRYAFDGRLRSARDFGPALGFDPREFSLFPVRIATWRGLIFVALDREIAPLSDWIAPVERWIGGADWSNLRISLRRRHELVCNWKTYVENYLEGYHLPVLHPGLNAEVDAARYTVRVEGRVVFQDAPTRSADTVYNGSFAWLWPNIAINLYSEGLMIESMVPVGHGATRLDYLYLTPQGVPVPAQTLALSDAVTAEDKWIVERVQENLNAGLYDTGRLSPRHESGVAAFQSFVRGAIAPLNG
jgi:choline monooxygenase